MLRSSSTPILGSLLPSFTDSPSNSIHCEASHAFKHLPPTCVHQQHHKLSFHQTGSFGLSSFSCSSSPISPSIADLERQNKGFRRVQSEGNLEDLAYSSFNNNNKEDRLNYIDTPKRFSVRNKCLALETIPSFTINSHKGVREEEEDEDEEMESDYEDGEERGEMRAMEGRGDGLSLLNGGGGMVLIEEVRVKDGLCRVSFDEKEKVGGKEMYLARGLGIDGCSDGMGGCRGSGGGGRGGDYNSMSSGGNDGDRHGVEEYYKRMVEENPGNPLFLRNYAKFLHQVISISF